MVYEGGQGEDHCLSATLDLWSGSFALSQQPCPHLRACAVSAMCCHVTRSHCGPVTLDALPEGHSVSSRSWSVLGSKATRQRRADQAVPHADTKTPKEKKKFLSCNFSRV